MNIQTLRKLNPSIKFYDITDPLFSSFGSVLDSTAFSSYFDYLEQHTQIPLTMNQYIAHDPSIIQFFNGNRLIDHVYQHEPIQFGYVNGNNSTLNALEFHQCPEINLALTPLVLMLGLTSDIKNGTYDVSHLRAFYIPSKTAVLLHPTTLHFSPCKVSDSGFKCGVILSYGTNMNFISSDEKRVKNDPLLFKTNKWLIAHPENQTLLDLGAFPGLIGENLMIQYK